MNSLQNSESSFANTLNEHDFELYRLAAKCGLEPEQAGSDLTDAMKLADEQAMQYSTIEDWREMMSKMLGTWWDTFVSKYFERCTTRFTHFAYTYKILREYQLLEKLWFELYEPLWLAGCMIARENRISRVKNTGIDMAQHSSPKLDAKQKREIQDYFNKLADKFGEYFLKSIEEYKMEGKHAYFTTMEASKIFDKVLLPGIINGAKKNVNEATLNSFINHSKLAFKLQAEGNNDGAITEWTKAIEVANNSAVAYFNRGELFIKEGKRAEAVVDFEKVVSLAESPELTRMAQGHLDKLKKLTMKRLEGILTKEQERAGLYLEEGEYNIFLKGHRKHGSLISFKKGTPPEKIRAKAQKCLSKARIEP